MAETNNTIDQDRLLTDKSNPKNEKNVSLKPDTKDIGGEIETALAIDGNPRTTLNKIAEGDSEYLTAKKSRARVLFEGVYEQLKKGMHGNTPEEKGQRFVEGIAQKANMHIGEIKAQNLTNQSIYQEIWGRMSEYVMRYSSSTRFDEKKQHVSEAYSRLTGHINKLVSDGEVDILTAKVFARYLDRYKDIGGIHYNAIVANNQDLPEGALRQKAPEYTDSVNRLKSEYGDDNVEEQDSGGFLHFNADKVAGDISTRVYINPDLNESPARVLEAWHTSLMQTGLKDKVYFKIPDNLSKRQEGIIVYITDKTDPSDVEKILTTFSNVCPPDLLSNIPMPSAVLLTRGIAIAPELNNINTFLKYSGKDKNISYNEWVASSTQLAFELAYNEASDRGETNITPKMLKDTAGIYFEKLVKLSGINPETMIPNSTGGMMPSWASNFKK